MERGLEDHLMELYGAMQVLRGMGFAYDDVEITRGIFEPTRRDRRAERCWGVKLSAQGKEFHLAVVPEAWVPKGRKFLKKWVKFIEAANAKPYDQELHARLRVGCEASHAWQSAKTIGLALAAKGFYAPMEMN